MFHAHTSAKYQPITEKELLDAVLIPSEERTGSDHQTIFKFFDQNDLLC